MDKKNQNKQSNTQKETLRDFLTKKVESIQPFASNDSKIIEKVAKSENDKNLQEANKVNPTKFPASIFFTG